mgnify:CR=1 FL=1
MVRQSAFEKTGNPMLKGGLHCHTTRSDGEGDPAEVIRLHDLKGYDFLALTDHRIYNYKNFAPETGVLIVPGMEIDSLIGTQGTYTRHTVSIGPSPDDGNGFRQDQFFERLILPEQDEYQRVILDRLHENNNLTFYCHPEWSGTVSRDFDRLKGNFAMEIWNGSCVFENDMDADAAYWDELLRQGNRIHGVAVDDGHPMHAHCNGWVRVNARKDLNSILAALNAGSFYSSCGPEIYDFRIDDEHNAVIECSPAEKICFHYGYSPTHITFAESAPLERAAFPVPEYFTYVRVSVVDKKGLKAWTNPIFLK